MHELELVPVRLLDEFASVRLGAMVLRLIGWRAVCTCGGRSRVWSSRSQAACAARLHVL